MKFCVIHLACACWLGLLANVGPAQSTTRTLLAEPQPQGVSPFLPKLRSDVRLPVALSGFCVVTLRENQKWLSGSEAYQQVFDEQIYWFASRRERAIFAAAPQRYVPALAGDCVVTFAETGVRKRGIPEHGVLHGGRLFFFASGSEKETFESATNRYDTVDLAHQGQCIVSLIDRQRQTPGQPDTTVIVDGLRYQFAGIREQQAFLSNMSRYGVVQSPPTLVSSTSSSFVNTPPPPLAPNTSSIEASVSAQVRSKDIASNVELTDRALDGYCPVTIRQSGAWTEGKTSFAVEFDGRTYLLAGPNEQRDFLENPNAYIPAFGGDCVVTQIASNKRVRGTIYHASHFDDRLYLFAGADQKQVFKASPGAYVNADLAASGNCIVSMLDENTTVQGRPQLVSWHRGKRYYFASPSHQQKFRDNVERYQER